MSVFWAVFLPLFLIGICIIGFSWAARLHFFSKSARSLERIDIPNEVKEVRINELEMLVCDEADAHFKLAWDLTRWGRWKATSIRFRETRKWLYFVISNAALFQEVARFQMQIEVSTVDDLPSVGQELPFRVLDRASTVQFMATVCLAKLLLLDVYRSVWPIYTPELGGRFEVCGRELIVWYRHLAREMLELAEEHYDDVVYRRFIFQLTGLFSVEAAASLNRI